MPWRPHGRAQVDPDNPRAFAIDDRSGFLYNLRDLQWQREWSGTQLTNLRILVSEANLDTPQEQLRSIVLPPDPLPIMNARPEYFAIDETNFLATQSGNNLMTESGNYLILENGSDFPLTSPPNPIPSP